MRFFSLEQILLSKFPSFDLEWPDEIKIKWFEDFLNLIKYLEEMK
jgi:hypothetical protein